MSGLRIVMGLAVGLALATGCDKKEPATPTAPKPPTPDVTPTASASTGAKTPAPSGAATTGGTVTPTTAPAITKTPVSQSSTTAPATQSTPNVAAGGETGDAGIVPVKPAPSGDEVKQAQDLIAKAIASLKDNKPDEARASIEKVEAMTEALPKTIYEQLKTVRANLDSIDKARRTELPTLGDEVNK